MFISILITLYINRQQAINSKSINDIISSGEYADLAIFFFFLLAGARVKEMRGVEISRQDEFRREMGELQCRRLYGEELATNPNAYSILTRKTFTRRLLDWLLAQSRSSILEFHEYARNYFLLQAKVHYRKICILKRKRKMKKIHIQFWAYFAQIQPKERRQQIIKR